MTDKKIIAVSLILLFAALSPIMFDDSTVEGGVLYEDIGKITVYVNDVEKQTTYNTMEDALAYVNNVANIPLGSEIRLECDAGKPIIFHGAHIVIQRSMTINGNNAFAVPTNDDRPDLSKEVTFDIDNATNPLIEDTVLTINEFHNATVWGTRTTSHVFNLYMNDCNSGPNDCKGFRVYLTGTAGVNNITLNNCDFRSNSSTCTVYSNANGSINLNDCTFSDVKHPININSKADNVDVEINIQNCTFTDCAQETDDNHKNYAAPIRVVKSGANGNSSVSVDSCSFKYSPDMKSANGDILIGDGRPDETSYDVGLTVSSTDAEVQFQSPNYYNASGEKDFSKITSTSVAESQVLTSSGESFTVVEAPTETPSNPGFDDEDDEYPFIPGQNTSSGNDDTTTYIAVAAAAAVVAVLAVLVMAMSKGKL